MVTDVKHAKMYTCQTTGREPTMKHLMISMMLIFSPLVMCGNTESFMEENNLYLEDNVNLMSNMTEDQFNSVIEDFQTRLGDISENTGMSLKVLGHWDDPTVNAYTYVQGNVRVVEIFGGLARRSEVTVDALTLVLCHEVGHHLGGFPTYRGWASDEGQSDYYSTLVCAKTMWKNQCCQKSAKKQIPKHPKKLCDDVWWWKKDRQMCYRSMMAGKALGDLMSRSGSVDYDTPDENYVVKTYHSHPDAQCRLDTYMAGSLCDTTKWNHHVIPRTEEEAYSVSCPMGEYDVGWRPRCWFKPSGN